MSNSSLRWTLFKIRWWLFKGKLSSWWSGVWSGSWIRQFCSVDRILDGLLQERPETQKIWLEAMQTKRLNVLQLKQVIQRSADPFPDESTTEELLRLVREQMTVELIAPIIEVYDRLQSRASGQSTALRLLTDLKTAESTQAVAELLARPSSKDVTLSTVFVPIAGDFSKVDQAGAKLFAPLLANFSRFAQLRDQHTLFVVAYRFADKRLLNLRESQYRAFRSACLARGISLQQEFLQRNWDFFSDEGANDEWTDDEYDKSVVEQEMYVIVVLLGFAGMQEAAHFLNLLESDRFGRRIAIAATTSLHQIGENVTSDMLRKFAENPEGRYLLWERLEAIGALQLFPVDFRDQQLLAEAEMVQWLCHPMEYGRAPKAIEFLETRHLTAPGKGPMTYYAFRYLEPGKDIGRWLVGVAGPYSDFDPPTMGGRWTFSRGDEYTPETQTSSIDRLIRE